MDLTQIQALAAEHPVATHAAAVLVGTLLGHQALTWVETVGVDAVVKHFRARQRLMAKRLGFTDEQILAAEQKEAAAAVAMAQRAAADLAKPPKE